MFNFLNYVVLTVKWSGFSISSHDAAPKTKKYNLKIMVLKQVRFISFFQGGNPPHYLRLVAFRDVFFLHTKIPHVQDGPHLNGHDIKIQI